MHARWRKGTAVLPHQTSSRAGHTVISCACASPQVTRAGHHVAKVLVEGVRRRRGSESHGDGVSDCPPRALAGGVAEPLRGHNLLNGHVQRALVGARPVWGPKKCAALQLHVSTAWAPLCEQLTSASCSSRACSIHLHCAIENGEVKAVMLTQGAWCVVSG